MREPCAQNLNTVNVAFLCFRLTYLNACFFHKQVEEWWLTSVWFMVYPSLKTFASPKGEATSDCAQGECQTFNCTVVPPYRNLYRGLNSCFRSSVSRAKLRHLVFVCWINTKDLKNRVLKQRAPTHQFSLYIGLATVSHCLPFSTFASVPI